MRELISREVLKTLFTADCGSVGVAVASPPPGSEIEYAIYRQIEAFSKKAVPLGGVSLEHKVASREALNVLESDNAKVNSRFRTLAKKGGFPPFVALVQNEISRILPPLNFVEKEIWESCRFGPGATFLAGGPAGVHILSKIGGKQSVTRRAFGLVEEVVSAHYPNWYNELRNCKTSFVDGNRLAFVPKDESKCRQIAVEPSLNLFLQMGVGYWLVGHLSRFGIDLRDQSLNREYARQGSLTGDLSTIDMSDASSRIAREVVRTFLPSDWFELLDTIRSPGFVEDNTFHSYEMFSSQGNAFTFPLESLIFAAIARVTCTFVSVYGDDIICDTNSFSSLVERLEFCGFVVNDKKSFSTGSFRESCGGDFIRGINVRPIYYKVGATRPSEVAKLHNLLLETWGWLPQVHGYLRSCVPKALFGPRYYWNANGADTSNHVSSSYDSYFWLAPWEEPVVGRPIKFWGSSPKPIGLHGYSDRVRELAFLYSGRDVESSSTLRRYFVGTGWFLPYNGKMTAPRLAARPTRVGTQT